MKRWLDVVLAAGGLLLLSPVILLLMLLVRIKLGSPVLFVQMRAGHDGKPFAMVKLRTMRQAQGPDGKPLPDAERMTPFGAWLRNTSLDELPELLNVLKGEMSLVGPRPLLMEYLDRYTPEQARRHHVKPGVTGWAQIHGRNAISWEEKFLLDVWYVDHRSLILDVTILWKTLAQVWRRQDIAATGCVTMPEFLGAKPLQKYGSLHQFVSASLPSPAGEGSDQKTGVGNDEN